MKKTLVASILGLAMTVASSFGQGHVFFNNYVGTVYQPVKYNTGEVVGSGFSAQLYYGLGSGLSFNQLTLLPSSTTTIGTQVAGYITGGILDIPGYSSGPITFAIVAFNGADWATSTAKTLPQNVSTWTETSIPSGNNPAATFQQNVPAVIVTVPEPSTFALAGIGSAALMIFRRRK